MRTDCCCTSSAKNSVRVGGNSFARRCHDIARWLLPAGGLVLLPKCPACLAAYVAIVTGLGISISTATYLRMLLVTICIAAIAYFAAKRGYRIFELISGGRRGGHAVGHPAPFAPSTTCEDHDAPWQSSGHQL
jgi:hypothetical protein